MRKGSAQSSEARAKIAASQHARWEARKTEDAYRRVVAHYYAAVEDEAPPAELLAQLDKLLTLCPANEASRWSRWRRAAARPGSKLRIAVFPAEVLAGDDLAAVERARRELQDDAALEQELEQQ